MFFFPYRIDHRLERRPWVTIGLIASCTLAYVLSFVGGTGPFGALAFRVAPSGLFTWFTSMFLHADPIHLIGNMYFLWLMGSVVEDALGHGPYLLIYVVGGLASSLLHAMVIAAFMPELIDVPSVGASGALAAVMGVFAVRFYKTRVKFVYFVMLGFFPIMGKIALPSAIAIALWLVQQVVAGVFMLNGVPGNVAYWSHVGGLLCGVGIALTSGYARRATIDYLAHDASRWSMDIVGEITAERYAVLARKDPENPEWHLKWALSAMNAHPPDHAVAAREVRVAIAQLLKRGEVDSALDAYNRIGIPIRVDGLDSKTLLTLASRAEATAQWRVAADAYRGVLDTRTNTAASAKALFRLAHVYLRLDLPLDAQETWIRFVAENPGSEWVGFADPRLQTAGV